LVKKVKGKLSKSKIKSRNIKVNIKTQLKTADAKTHTNLEYVPVQEIEDLFSEPVDDDKIRNEQTVLSNWKKFMSRN
jgi:hypothetical protein